MNYLRTINFLLILFLFISCKKFDQNNFKILPSVKEYTFTGNYSNLNINTNFSFHSKNNDTLPVILDNSIKLIKGDINSKIIFEIDKNYDIVNEGYFLKINKDQIKIIAKDNAGLFYSFNTLNQLLKEIPISFIVQ